jgi:hypothetical protein
MILVKGRAVLAPCVRWPLLVVGEPTSLQLFHPPCAFFVSSWRVSLSLVMGFLLDRSQQEAESDHVKTQAGRRGRKIIHLFVWIVHSLNVLGHLSSLM